MISKECCPGMMTNNGGKGGYALRSENGPIWDAYSYFAPRSSSSFEKSWNQTLGETLRLGLEVMTPDKKPKIGGMTFALFSAPDSLM
jgi:hypothetical protein